MSQSPIPLSQGFSPTDAVRLARDHVEAQPHLRLIGVAFAAAAPGMCELRLPHRPDLTQGSGTFHEGVIGTLASATGAATAQTLLPKGNAALTVEFKVNIITPARGEALLARGHVVRAGKSLTVCRVDISTVNGTQQTPCATCLMTLMSMPG